MTLATEVEREPGRDRELGPELKADEWIVIGGENLMWLHPASHRCVTLSGPSPRKKGNYDCLGVLPLRGEPADPTTEGYIVSCTKRGLGGEPVEGSTFWVEGYGEALAYARSIRASVLAETPPVEATKQEELFPVVGTERTPQPWARKILFVTYLGVLATSAFADGHEKRLKEDAAEPPEGGLDPALVVRLSAIVKRTDCDVVASDALRYAMTLPQASRLLRARGLEADLYDATPEPHVDEDGFLLHGRLAPVAAWLAGRADVQSFAILESHIDEEDDEELPKLGHRVVRVDAKVGLTDADVRRAVSLLEMPR